MKEFDIIIAGGGAAGLSMAYYLAKDQAFDGQRVLVIDKQPKEQNDRTWCYWHDGEMPFDQLAYRSWQKISFLGPNLHQVFSLPRMKYYMVKGIDFYRHTLDTIRAKSNFHLLEAEVLDISAMQNGGKVRTNLGDFFGKKVLDSLYLQKDIPSSLNGHPFCLQHFKGWHISTEKAVFEPDTMQMFDFTIPQSNEVRFVYILPFSANEAMVEYTIFSAKALPPSAYDPLLKAYILEKLQVPDYKVHHEEYGVIPMTTYPFPAQKTENIIYLGTKAGLCKPSTGYAFLRIQRDCQQIAHNLKNKLPLGQGRPFQSKFQFYDTLMLDIMERDGGSVSSIFEDIFRKNPIERVLKFLDERTSFKEDLKIITSVPSMPFLYSIARWLGRKVFGSLRKKGARD